MRAKKTVFNESERRPQIPSLVRRLTFKGTLTAARLLAKDLSQSFSNLRFDNTFISQKEWGQHQFDCHFRRADHNRSGYVLTRPGYAEGTARRSPVLHYFGAIRILRAKRGSPRSNSAQRLMLRK